MTVSAAGHSWTLSLTLRSPFLIRATRTDSIVLDAAQLRRSDSDRRPVLPGSLVRGLLRDALWTLLTKGVRLGLPATAPDDLHDLVGTLLGVPSDRRPRDIFAEKASGPGHGTRTIVRSDSAAWRVDNEPDRRTLLKIDDLIAAQVPADEGRLTRIQVDPDLGAVQEGHLQVVELPFPLGTEVTFTGTVTLYATARTDAATVETLLTRALPLIRAVGGFKSAGFGEVVRADLRSNGSETATAPALPGGARLPAGLDSDADTVLELVYALDRPFVVNSRQRGGNAFEGDPIIPGAVVKGALANRLQDLGASTAELRQLLAAVGFGHAVPVPADQTHAGAPRPRTIPLSLVRIDGRLHDLLADPDALADPAAVPIFQVDWKDGPRAEANRRFGQPDPPPQTEARTRTAICYEHGAAKWDSATETGQLFTEIAVVPDAHRWVGRLAVPAGTDRAGLAQLLACLADGVPRIGKTEAIVSLATPPHVLPPDPVAPTRRLSDGRPAWAVVLQTDALINDLDALRASDGDVAADYTRYWADQGFDLIDWYAAQRLYGGYLALRYPQRPDRYEPYLVTEAGSAFLLAARPDSADPEARLRRFCRFGLPLAAPFAQADWQTCPFLPENGFGAVRVGTDPTADPTAGPSPAASA